MSNLIDKQKLLNYLSKNWGSPSLVDAIESGDLDFHPQTGLPTGHLQIDSNKIKSVCMGIITGKACEELQKCGFIQDLNPLPCERILDSLSSKSLSITSMGRIIWGGSK